jgi:hypothetical protein
MEAPLTGTSKCIISPSSTPQLPIVQQPYFGAVSDGTKSCQASHGGTGSQWATSHLIVRLWLTGFNLCRG